MVLYGMCSWKLYKNPKASILEEFHMNTTGHFKEPLTVLRIFKVDAITNI